MDLSKLSDAQLQALYAKPAADFSKMSDAELSALYNSQSGGVTVDPADIAKSAGVGVGKGAIGIAGTAGDARTLLSSGVSKLGDAFGVAPDRVQQFKDLASGAARVAGTVVPGIGALPDAPTSNDIRKTVEGYTGEFYKPQTTLGNYAETAGEMLPAAAFGVGGIGRRVLTQAVIPGLASEAAGQLTKGTEAEPYARIGGALVGGTAAGKLANSFAERTAAKAAPTTAEIKSATSQTYDNLTARSVATPLRPTDLNTLADDIRTTLNNKGIRPSNAGSVHSAVDELRTPASAGAADVADLVAGRQSIKELLGKQDTNTTGAVMALAKIEKAIEQASPGTMRQIKEADKNWAVVKANEALDKKMARADLRAAGEHSGLNLGNRIRQNVTNYLVSNEARYLSKEQREALEKVVKGTASQNVIRWASNLMGGGGGIGSTVLGLGGVAAGTYTGNPELAFLPVAGVGARVLSNRMTAGQAAKSAASLRSASPYGQSLGLAAPATSNPMISGLLAGLLAAPRN